MQLTLTLIGIAPLILQSDRTVNQLDPLTREIKAIAAKKNRKTDEDIRALSRLEFTAALYFDEAAGPYIPGDNIQASLRRGGSFAGRLGRDIERAVVVRDDVNPIKYDGPRTVDDLWSDPYFCLVRSVVQQRQRIMRTRPIFRAWSVETTIDLATDLMNRDAFERAAEMAGQMEGIGTWRPRYGRYEVQIAA